MFESAKFIEVSAGVRYWEDARVDGIEDEVGDLIPFRSGGLWVPVIGLDGIICDWPNKTADIHYKVCDQGEYWLLDENKKRIAKWRGCYVPNRFLCHGDAGYGDYIIFSVDEAGKIANWRTPQIEESQWDQVNENQDAA